jgi:hypothetical protein
LFRNNAAAKDKGQPGKAKPSPNQKCEFSCVWHCPTFGKLTENGWSLQFLDDGIEVHNSPRVHHQSLTCNSHHVLVGRPQARPIKMHAWNSQFKAKQNGYHFAAATLECA